MNMKADIRDKLRQIAFPETTTLTSPVVLKKSKGAKKSNTTRDKSDWEHADARYPDCHVSHSKASTSSQKCSELGRFLPTQSSQLTIPRLDEMPLFMQPYIENIVDVKGDGWCGYRVVALDSGKTEDDFELVKLNMVREIKMHRPLYEKVFGSKDRLDYILKALHPSEKVTRNRVAPLDKWLTFPDMGHVIATYYKKVVVELTKPSIGISETFFPLRDTPPQDPSSRILCLGLVPNHFVYVKLKENCPLPPTSGTWKEYCTDGAKAWEFPFMDRQRQFGGLMDIEIANLPKKKVKKFVGVGSSASNPMSVSDESD